MTRLAATVLLTLLPSQEKLPVPAPAVQERARAQIRDLLKEDFARRDEAGKRALAARLIALERGTPGDPAARYVMLCEARDASAEAGDAAAALHAVDRLAAVFSVDAGALRLEGLEGLKRRARSTEDLRRLAQEYLRAAEAAIQEEDFDDGITAAREAGSLARRARESTLAEEAAEMAKAIPDLKREREQARSAELALTGNPDDPAANLALGRYRCFIEDRWEEGLKLLAKGSDAGLREVAAREIAAPGNPAALGDAWWDLGAKAVASDRPRYRGRAVFWYRSVLPTLQGLSKLKVDHRIEEAEGEAAASALRRPRTIDLLRLADPARHAISGAWTLEGGKLVVARPSNFARIRFPVVPKGSYDLEVRFERSQGARSIAFPLPLGDRGVGVVLSWREGTRSSSGLSSIRDRDVTGNPTTREGTITSNHVYDLGVRVRLDGRGGVTIETILDGSPYFSWTGPISDLEQEKRMAITDPVSLGISANDSVLTIHHARLRMVSGRAESVR